MENILKVVVYYLFLVVVYFVLKRQFARSQSCDAKKITVMQILFIAICIGLFSIISMAPLDSLDHSYYVHRFTNGWDISASSFGLNLVFKMVHTFSNNIYVLYFLVNSFTTLVVLLIYRKWDKMTPQVLFLIFASEYFLYGFSIMKQTFANVFALCFVYEFLNGRKLLSIVFIACAILFHNAALMLVPIFLMLLLAEQKWARFGFWTLALMLMIFFVPIADYLVHSQQITEVLTQADQYVDASGNISITSNFLTILKGLPVYIIFIVGLLKRKTFSEKIENYNQFMVLAGVASLAVILSSYIYWTFRFACLIFIPCIIFFQQLQHTIEKPKNKMFFRYGVPILIVLLGLKYFLQMLIIYGGF